MDLLFSDICGHLEEFRLDNGLEGLKGTGSMYLLA